jgi:hypothetical protein
LNGRAKDVERGMGWTVFVSTLHVILGLYNTASAYSACAVFRHWIEGRSSHYGVTSPNAVVEFGWQYILLAPQSLFRLVLLLLKRDSRVSVVAGSLFLRS